MSKIDENLAKRDGNNPKIKQIMTKIGNKMIKEGRK